MDDGPRVVGAPLLKRYQLQTRLARGGTGEVFRALCTDPDAEEEDRSSEPVVVRRIMPLHVGSQGLTEQFLAEARVMQRLDHPNLVRVLDYGVGDDGNFLLVQELVHGLDFARFCRWLWAREEQLPVPLALYVVAQALRGLAHAHTHEVAEGEPLVHRDVSPGNILLSTTGQVKLADFGVALAEREPSPPDSTREVTPSGRHLLTGKPDYMAPEQFDGAPVDARADLFSVGVVLYEALTGSRPFSGASVSERMEAVHAGRAQSVRDLRPDVGPELEALLARALAPHPEDRFPDASTMAHALDVLRSTVASLPEERRSAVTRASSAATALEDLTVPEEASSSPEDEGTSDGLQGDANQCRGRSARPSASDDLSQPDALDAALLAELLAGAIRDVPPPQPSLRPPADAPDADEDLTGRELLRSLEDDRFTLAPLPEPVSFDSDPALDLFVSKSLLRASVSEVPGHGALATPIPLLSHAALERSAATSRPPPTRARRSWMLVGAAVAIAALTAIALRPQQQGASSRARPASHLLRAAVATAAPAVSSVAMPSLAPTPPPATAQPPAGASPASLSSPAAVR
ncbi:uncharacterized protein CMC5_033040 [Chondromyces crocatus]|uniref:Protein kinase domain-containing protein n=2 Tax=Chondromyces crocatus TaxID=52 RepID=A0A0K1EEP8_CHOCO|nr:uncharacterized protein CMC5_033040 [Chondromyces crocatus]